MAPFLGKTNFVIQIVSQQAKTIQFDGTDLSCPVELIVMETALRLESQYQASFFDIDEIGLLPLTLLPRPGNNGLVHKIRHRYILTSVSHSKNIHFIYSDLPISPSLHFLAKFHSRPAILPGLSDFQSRLESVVSIFCPNLNCLQPYCAVHGETLCFHL
jgi:histone-lysine N-methyltransferase EZH2